jgi:hypothetical protein
MTNDDDENDNNSNQTGAGNYNANFLAQLYNDKTGLKTLKQPHTKNVSSDNVFLPGIDILVAGPVDIRSGN